MSKVTSERTKPQVSIGTIGYVDHGKTTLTTAIVAVLALKHGGSARAFDQMHDAPPHQRSVIPFDASHVDYDTAARHYAHVDCPAHADYIKGMVTGAVQLDGAVLVVDATIGLMPQTREQVLLAREVGVRSIVAFLNKCDQVDDQGQLAGVEKDVRALLSKYGFPGDSTPVIRGSALKALDGDADWQAKIIELAEALDRHVPAPEPAAGKPFLMPVQDVFNIRGRGTVVSGQVERGTIKTGDQIEIIGFRDTQKTTCAGIEQMKKPITEARAGEHIGMNLQDIDKDNIERGQVLAKPGTITPHTTFKAEVYVARKDEGGRDAPFFTNYRPQTQFHTTDVTSTITLPAGVERVMPGDNITMTIELIAPVALEEGSRFAIHEGGKTVAAGIVTEIIT